MSENVNNLLSRYLNQYQKNRRSRVFAPLAEAYRKIGMLDEALQTLKEGIRFHPDYQLAYLVLANCYFDLQEFNKAYDVLKPMSGKNPDNLKLHHLFGEVCEKLSLQDEALNAYKNVLFINPYDEVVAEKVKTLEESEEIRSKYEIKRTDPSKIEAQKTDEEDWVAIDLSLNEKDTEEEKEETEEDVFDQWSMSKDNLTPSKKTKPKPVEKETSVDDEIDSIISSEEPFVTHTLVDIYIAQKHFEKARELLDKILESNPEDEKSRKKLEQVVSKLGDSPESYYKRLEKKYLEFLAKIRARAEIYTRA